MMKAWYRGWITGMCAMGWLVSVQASEMVVTVQTHFVGEPVTEVVVDEATISRLPQYEIVTGTPWDDGVHSYRGPRLLDLLNRLGIKQGRQVTLHALNEYSATLPFSDLRDFSVILAHSQDGQPLSVRQRGPFFLMYPFDELPRLKSKLYYARSVWQIDRITVE
jgi:hypothetical protein